MKMTNKKGFTIVELVIVVAVIAILSAVLIPTVAGLVKKANLTADQTAARQMNEALASVEKTPATLEEAINALESAGYNAGDTLVPVTKNHKFMWFAEFNVIALVSTEETTPVLVYPADDKYKSTFLEAYNNNGMFDLENGVAFVDATASKADDFADALDKGNQNIKLNKDVKLPHGTAYEVKAGNKVVIDLGGKTLTTGKNQDATPKSEYALDVYGTATLKNGTISARGVYVRAGGKLIIENDVTINALDDNGGACIYLYGGELVINGGTFTAPNGNMAAPDATAIIANPGSKVTINGGNFKSTNSFAYLIENSGNITINGGTFSADRGVVLNKNGGVVTINGGTFTVSNPNSPAYALYCSGEGSVVNVNGGSFYGSENAKVTICWTDEMGAGAKINVKKGVVVDTYVYTEDTVIDSTAKNR